ncbi:dTDP-4-dehydrorhamnose 3,5-epimerase [Flavobacteriaceae bacterium]|nr:dTDP-4-dehydrorhamnose 3,5-epimerase [Flavobacteriaceae bacterium]
MIFNKTKFNSAYTIDLDPIEDDRGFFARYFCKNEFEAHNLNTEWKQINNSFSKDKFTLRGLHYQEFPSTEVKLVRCIKGSIWDVIVDLRENSKTYGEWFGTELNEINRKMMYVPKGFAHGFLSLSANSEIIYLVSDFYSKENERSLLWSDESIGIKWPDTPQIISDKDSVAPKLRDILPVKN